MTILDRDFGAIALERFGGRLHAATLTRVVGSGYDIDDPAAGTTKGAAAVYTCDAVAFRYKQQLIDGEHIIRGDYRVVILRSSIKDSTGAAVDLTPMNADKIAIPPPGQTANKDATVIAVEVITDAQITIQVRGLPA